MYDYPRSCDNYIRGRDGKRHYAIKQLSSGLYKKDGNPFEFITGFIDLAMEVKFLRLLLRHPHIIKMRAMADCDPCSRDFFVILDRLDETLETRLIASWKKQKPKHRPFLLCFPKGNEFFFFRERLAVGYDICSALLTYLHEQK